MLGIDRHPWAVAEANWTYRQLGIRGKAVQRDAAQARIDARAGTAVLAAYALNEFQAGVRDALLARMLESHAHGARLLIVEPIARRTTPWWRSCEAIFFSRGGRSDEWRFPMTLPRLQQKLARAAGLDPREITARDLLLALTARRKLAVPGRREPSDVSGRIPIASRAHPAAVAQAEPRAHLPPGCA